MADKKVGRGVGNKVVARFDQGVRTYEKRWVRCGKSGCWCTSPSPGQPEGHGPYWYLCGMHDGRWRRVYLGRDVDTTRWVLADGLIDWAAVDARPRSRQMGVKNATVGVRKSGGGRPGVCAGGKEEWDQVKGDVEDVEGFAE